MKHQGSVGFFFFPPQSRALQIISLFMKTTEKAEGSELPALIPWYSPIPSLRLLGTARNTGYFIPNTEHSFQGERTSVQ